MANSTEGRLTPEREATIRRAIAKELGDMSTRVLAEELLAELDAVRRELAEARERMVRARSALENWGSHHWWCDARRDGDPPGDCNCGYVAAVNDANPVNVANTAAMAKDGDA